MDDQQQAPTNQQLVDLPPKPRSTSWRSPKHQKNKSVNEDNDEIEVKSFDRDDCLVRSQQDPREQQDEWIRKESLVTVTQIPVQDVFHKISQKKQ